MNAKVEHREVIVPTGMEFVPAVSDSGALMKIIERAASDPAFDVAKLAQLLEVKTKWEENEAKKAFVTALTAFKANPPTLTKNKHVKFGTTEYDHATLDKVTEIIGRALSQHGLSHRWEVEQKDAAISVSCVLTHEKGHSESVKMQATADTSGSKNSIQAIGSTVTYLQRYTLLAATGLAAKGQDDDGIGASAMDEKVRLDFETAIDSAADATSLEKTWKTVVAECRKTPKDLDSYNALKQRVADKGKQLKGKK